MIFLNEDIVSSGFSSIGTSLELKKLNEELGLNEADFAQFANPNAGYEICYEMEVAFNALERQMLNEEAAILLSEAEEDEKESKGFWSQVWETLVKWAKYFIEILGKAWNAIKNFFKKIWEFLFGKKAKENAEETKKELKLAPSDIKYKFIKVDFDAIKDMWTKLKRIEDEAKKSISDGTVVIAARDLQVFVKDVKKELKDDVVKFKENKDAVIGTAAEAAKNLENALQSSGFVGFIHTMTETFLAKSRAYTAQVKKQADKIKELSGKKDSKEDLKEAKNAAASYKVLATLMKEMATTGTSIVSTVSPAIRGAQNPKKVRA